jgi:hypothetical protein
MERDWALMAVLGATALASPVVVAVVTLAIGVGAGGDGGAAGGPVVGYRPVRLAVGLGLAAGFLGIALWLIARTDWSLGDGEG